MPGYQPRLFTDHVWYNGTDVMTYAKSTGLGVRLTEIRGWDDRPDVRDTRELRSGQDGEYANNAFLGGRTISLSGVVHGSSWEDLQSRKRALAAVFTPGGDEVLFKVPEPDASSPTDSYSTTGMTDYERVSCRVVEPILFGDMVGSAAMTFQVVLRASDPRVYSDTVTSTDSGTTGTSSRTVTVDQGGTYETPPTLTVTGPTASTWSVQESTSGLSLAMSGPTLTSAESVAFDTNDRTITYTTTYRLARLTSTWNTVALWMLDETSGTTADNAQGTAAYDGTYTGGYTLNQSGPSGLTSVDLNGSTGYVSVAYNAALNPSSFSIEAWVYYDENPSTGAATFVSSGVFSPTWRGYQFGIGNTNGVYLTTLNGSSADTISSGVQLEQATWTHVVATYDGSSRTTCLYANGELIGTGIASAALVANTSADFRIGSLSGGTFLDGKIAGVRLSNVAHTAAQVAALYDASSSTPSTPAYEYLVAASSKWAALGTGSSTYRLFSSGLGSGSKLNVTYRDARL